MTARKVWRIVRWSALGVFLFMLALISTISTVVFTEFGSRWFIERAAGYLPIDIGEIKGNLLTGLDLEYLEYRIEIDGKLQQRYRAENISFRWQPLALFYSSVSVQSLTADSITVLLPPVSDAEPVPPQWPTLALPVIVELGQVQLDNISIERNQLDLPPQNLARLRSVSGSLSLGAFNLRATDLAVVTDQYTVIAGGRVALRYPYAAQLDVQWQYELAATDTQPEPLLFSGRGDVQGNVEQLDINHTLSAPFDIQSRIQITPNLSAPPDAISQTATPHLKASNEWPAQALLQQWFPEGAIIPVVAGRLEVEGWLNDYRGKLSGEVSYGDFPGVTIAGETRGDLQHVDISELALQLQRVATNARAATQATIAGRVTWAPELQWDLAVKASAINPEIFLADWPGNLQLSAKTSGGVTQEGLQVAVENLELEGRLRAFDVRAGGGFGFDGQSWGTENILLALGANHVRIKGRVVGNTSDEKTENYDVQWYLDAPLLSQLDTSLQGNLFSQGHLQGSRKQPQLSMQMRAQNLQWQDYALEKLAFSLKPDADAYQLSMTAQDLVLGEQRIAELAITGNGTLQQHHLESLIKSPSLGELDVELDSGYQEEKWQGQWTKFNLRLGALPRWRLLNSKPMSAKTSDFNFGELCLTTRSGERNQEADFDSEVIPATPNSAESETPAFCTRGQWASATGLELDGTLAAVPLRQLRAFLKPDVTLRGVIEGDFSLRLPTGKKPLAALNIRTRDGELNYQYADYPLEIYRWENAAVTAKWQNDLLTAKLANSWGKLGNIDGDISLNTATQKLAGNIHINFIDISPLAAFIPIADDVGGTLAADIELRGTSQKPQLLGQFSLSQGSAKIPRFGLELREFGVTVNTYGDGRIDLRSSVRSGEGILQISGELQEFGTPDWQLNGDVQGDNFLVVQQPQLEATITPSIHLVASKKELRLTGDALVPFARVELKSLPANATRVSDDVIIVEADSSNGREDEMDFYMNINAELGKDVTFSGFGLTSKLAGKMSLLQTPTRPLLATGYVDVVEGKYQAYGQELAIQRGRLIFQGPLDNPGLDIRAQRTLRGTTDNIVGLEIGGTLQRPTSSVYSDPPLQNEGEAMALLLTGKPLSEASAGDAYTIVSAMSGLGMDKGGSITSQIAQTFSLDEFKLSAEDGFEHSSLMVGKYLTERLFVRYIVGLFDQLSKIGVVYQMTDRLRLEAESGDIQSLDMIYKIER
jgi:translocation and assembly module TamB